MKKRGENLVFASDPLHDRILMGSPLRRPAVCSRVCTALLGLLIVAFLVHLGVIAGMRSESTIIFVVALLMSTSLSAVPIAILAFLDRREREKRFLLVAAFFWGGVITTAISLPLNTAFFKLVDGWVLRNPVILDLLGSDASGMLAAPLSAPTVEEIAKSFDVLLVFWLLRAEFDNMRDGIVYGAMVGVGFNWYEAALYVVQNYDEHGFAAFGSQLGGRYALFGLGGHTLYTGLFGAFLGFAIQSRSALLRIAAPFVGLILAMLAHMLNNAMPLLVTVASDAPPGEPEGQDSLGFIDSFVAASQLQLAIYWPLILLMAFAIWRSGVWERRAIREELSDEVGRSVTAAEYREILNDRMLRTRRIDSDRSHVSAALANAQNELAFRKRRVKDEGDDPQMDTLVMGWREDIRRLREIL